MTSAVDDEIDPRRESGSDRTAGSLSSVRADREVRVAVVGSGVAGAGAAYALREADAAVTVYEREADVGGRTTTARRGDVRYDYGANYVKPGTERVDELVRVLDEGDLVDVTDPVWTFDADGTVAPGDDDRADDHKWTFEDGLATLPCRLLGRSSAEIRTGAHVASATRVRRDDHDRWHLQVEGTADGPYDAVVLTPPGPETGAVLVADPDDTGGDATAIDARIERVAAAARSIAYRPIASVVLHYPFDVRVPYYALVNVDRDHPIGWVSREECKRGHVPPGETVLVAQLSPARTRETSHRSDEVVAEETATMVATLLDDDRLAEPDWHATYRFERALPGVRADADSDTGDGGDIDDSSDVGDGNEVGDGNGNAAAVAADTGALEAAESLGLYVAGDWVRGEGRIHAALSSGLDAGDRLRTALRDGE